jgi:hypothetical protein
MSTESHLSRTIFTTLGVSHNPTIPVISASKNISPSRSQSFATARLWPQNFADACGALRRSFVGFTGAQLWSLRPWRSTINHQLIALRHQGIAHIRLSSIDRLL